MRPVRCAAILFILIAAPSFTQAAQRQACDTDHPRAITTPAAARRASGSRSDTLWIFDADFENTTDPDNQGWISTDLSGTLGVVNHWHRDTLRVAGFEHLGESAWWCGTYDPCWIQTRGYGNDWVNNLWRDFELSSWSSTGDTVTFDFDQRFAMELQYDYGYVDVSADGGATWTTLATFTNAGFPGTPGYSQDWDSAFGHQSLDLSSRAGLDVRVRFRFESDAAYSSQDEYPNPPFDSVLDGAWQIDNMEWRVSDVRVWYDDAEGGDNGWSHDDVQPSGQTNAAFERGLYGVDFETGGPFTCDEQSGWMYAALDDVSGLMVDGQCSTLRSPPIDISGAVALVGRWDGWLDCPKESNDILRLRLASGNDADCLHAAGGVGFLDYAQPLYGGPFWGHMTDDWSAFAGNNWLALEWMLENTDPSPGEHGTGFFLNRQRVGTIVGDPGTTLSMDREGAFRDRFAHELAAALSDCARVFIKDDDGVVSGSLMASADGGTTWSRYAMTREAPEGNIWIAPAPSGEIAPSTEISYYFESMDATGSTALLPADAPDASFEFSILPINGGGEDPCVLVVDKRDSRSPGERRDYAHDSDYYYREALEVLGVAHDVFDVAVPGAAGPDGAGPDTTGLRSYETIIWAASNASGSTATDGDVAALETWLAESSPGERRNLLMCGQNIAADLAASESGTSFLECRLGATFVRDTLGLTVVDSVVTLADEPGGWDFLLGAAAGGLVAGGCPELGRFDVVEPAPGEPRAETVARYELDGGVTPSAGVALCDTAVGRRSVLLGFGLDSLFGQREGDGHYASGLPARADLMSAILGYFEEGPGTGGTSVPHCGRPPGLASPFPNPCEGSISVRFTSGARGRLTVRVYSAAGRLVRTLHDSVVAERESRVLTWDGTDDDGRPCAGGVYFCRAVAPGVETARKMVLLR